MNANSYTDLSYHSSNTNVAMVMTNGDVLLRGKVGMTKITITAAETDMFKGAEYTVTLKVNPKNVGFHYLKYHSPGTIDLDWKTFKGLKYVEVQASKTKAFKNIARKTNVSAKWTGIFWDGFKRGNWYIRYRAVVKINGKKYYSSWSKVRKIKVKKS